MIKPTFSYQNQINKLRNELKANPITKELFEEYNIDISEIDFIPIYFAELPVSARTEHGIIYLNIDLIESDGEIDEKKWKENYHYIQHEITHFLQQTTGDGPTKGSVEDNYLDNEFEQEGFQQQTKFISHRDGEDEAENYIDQVLDHHEINGKEREEKKNELLEFASHKPKQLKLDFSEEPIKLNRTLLPEILEKIDEGKEKFRSKSIHHLDIPQREETIKRWKKIVDSLKEPNWDDPKTLMPRKLAQIKDEVPYNDDAYSHRLNMMRSLMLSTTDATRKEILNSVLNDYFKSISEDTRTKIEEFLSEVDTPAYATLPFSWLRRILRSDSKNLQDIIFSKSGEITIFNLYDSSSDLEKMKLQQILSRLKREIPDIPIKNIGN